jgi:hypothetical protein
MSSATFETSLTHQKRCASWNWYNLFIYCDATRDNSKFKLFHQQLNFLYCKIKLHLHWELSLKVSPMRLLIY